jgi:hypothetical protein
MTHQWGSIMEEQTNGGAQRLPYSRPVVEELGTLQDLTAAGGSNAGLDSAYVHGDPGAFPGVS